MNCGTLVIWNPVPDGSVLKAKTRGTNNNYDARIRVVPNHDPSIFWDRPQLDPGPASKPINAGDQLTVMPRVVIAGADPATVTMDIWVEKGGAKVRECTWQVTPEMSPFKVLISIVQGED
jgi:hypothetical protein